MKTLCKKLLNLAKVSSREKAIYHLGLPIHDFVSGDLIGIRVTTGYEYDEEFEEYFELFEDIKFTKTERQLLRRAGFGRQHATMNDWNAFVLHTGRYWLPTPAGLK